MTDTQWDDDRVVARVVPRSAKDPNTGLDNVGFVVQVLDAGPPDGRVAKPSLLYDSEATHGTAGLFGDEPEASEFSERMRVGTLAKHREIDRERRRRNDALAGRQRDLWAEMARQKKIAQDANKAAKAADDLARKLAEEAEDPAIVLSCNPSDKGPPTLWANPCWTDGTQEGDPRQLVIDGMGLVGPRQLAIEPRRKGKRPPPRATKASKPPAPMPEHVPDTTGLPIRKGTRVSMPGHELDGQPARGVVLDILGREGDHWVLEIEDERTGTPFRVANDECVADRIDEPEDDDHEGAA